MDRDLELSLLLAKINKAINNYNYYIIWLNNGKLVVKKFADKMLADRFYHKHWADVDKVNMEQIYDI